jgi:hypothetical protein
MNNLNDYQISFLKENYPKYGTKYCAECLNIKEHIAYLYAKSLGIRKEGRGKHPSKQNIDPRKFLNIIDKEISYFLGYFWADGYINYRVNKTSHCYKIALEIKSEDEQCIRNVIDYIGKWSKFKRKRKETWKETTIISTNSKDIYLFLEEKSYKEKRHLEPSKILEVIPENLKKYFWKGFFDGDGSISTTLLHGKPKKSVIQFSGTFGYKWIELQNLLKSLNVNFNIYNYKNYKGHSYSIVNITKKESVKIFSKYLLESEIGLKRKTEKLEEFVKRVEV